MKPRGASLLLTAQRIKVKRAVFNEIATSGEDTQPPSMPEGPPPAIPQRIHARRRRPPISWVRLTRDRKLFVDNPPGTIDARHRIALPLRHSAKEDQPKARAAPGRRGFSIDLKPSPPA